MKAVWRVGFSALISACVAVAAIADQDVSKQKGFSPEKVYFQSDHDNVALLNGNLSLDIPIGQRFSTNAGHGYQLSLFYNTKIWDYEETYYRETIPPPWVEGDPPPDPGPWIDAFPGRDFNAGLGWTLSLGKLLPPLHESRDDLTWAFMAGDGSEHEFFPKVHGLASEVANCTDGYTRDGTYYRLRFENAVDAQGQCIDPSTMADPGAVLEFPDGQRMKFQKSTRVMQYPTHFPAPTPGLDTITEFVPVELDDVFGNKVTIEYLTPGVDPSVDAMLQPTEVRIWRITVYDGNTKASTNFVFFKTAGVYPNNIPNVEVASRVVTQATAGRSAEYKFNYVYSTIKYDCARTVLVDTDNFPGSDELTVALLTSMQLPDNTNYAFSYSDQDTGIADDDTSSSVCSHGHLKSMKLPTGASFDYLYRMYDFPDDRCKDPHHPAGWRSTSLGVATRTVSDPATSFQSATWKYRNAVGERSGTTGYSCYKDDGTLEISFQQQPPEQVVTRVIAPDGARSFHFFSAWKPDYESPNHFVQSEHGLPFTRGGTAVNFRNGATGTETIAVPVSVLGANLSSYTVAADGQQRSKYLLYAVDPDVPPIVESTARNPRVTRDFTIYEGVPSCTKGTFVPLSGGTCETVGTVYSDFDGFGHFRTATSSWNFPNGVEQSVTTTWLNRPDSLVGSASTFDSGTLNDDGTGTFHLPPDRWILGTFTRKETSVGGRKAVSLFDFNDRGALTKQRTLSGVSTSATPSSGDLIAFFDRDALGNVITETYRGGDADPVSTAALSTLSAGSAPPYSVQNTYTNGTLATAQSVGLQFPFRSVDQVVDAATGLVTSSTEPSGLKTNFEYDTSGRITKVLPDTTQGVSRVAATLYQYEPTRTPPRITVIRTNQPDSSNPASLEDTLFDFDALGRLRREERKYLFGGVLHPTERFISYDTLGRKSGTTGFADVGSTQHWTLTNYDVFGRPVSVQTPDLKSTTWSYQSGSKVTRTAQIGDSTQPLTPTTSWGTIETRDGLGRLRSVREGSNCIVMPCQDADSTYVTTSYGYDESDHLVNVTSSGQTRSFTYDGRGFLISEVHPENGTTCYGVWNGSSCAPKYDARGHLLQKETGVTDSTQRNTLVFGYDAAERLRTVKSGSGVDLKVFTFDSDGAYAQNGKLILTKRTNAVAGASSVDVSEVYRYDARERAVSSRQTIISGGPSFTQSFSYDDLGDRSTTTYPQCQTADCSDIGAAVRVVNDERSGGYLSRISSDGVTASFDSNPNLTLGAVRHGNGVVDTITSDPSGMSRVKSIQFGGYADPVTCAAPVITLQPLSKDFFPGDPISLTVEVSPNSLPVTYQWYEGTSPSGVLLTGQTGPSLSRTPTGSTAYFVRVRAACGTTIDSYTAVITQKSSTSSSTCQVNILAAPRTTCVPINSAVGFKAQTWKDNLLITVPYQWFVSWSVADPPDETSFAPISGATTDSYTSVVGSSALQVWYRVQATCPGGTISKASVKLHWDRLEITQQPVSGVIQYGSTHHMAVAGYGYPYPDPPTSPKDQAAVFTWWKNAPWHHDAPGGQTFTNLDAGVYELWVTPLQDSSWWAEARNKTTTTCDFPLASQLGVVTVMPLLYDFASSAVEVLGGGSANATITLNRGSAYGWQDVPIELSSNSSALYFDSNTITIPGGKSVQTVPIRTRSTITQPVTAHVTATSLGTSRSFDVLVHPPAVSSLSITPLMFQSPGSATATVTLGAPAWAATSVSLSPVAVSPWSYPSSVTVPQGATQATFTISAVQVASGRTLSLTATANGLSATASVTSAPRVAIALVPNGSMIGGTRATGEITLGLAAPYPVARVTLSSSDARLVVPDTVDVAGGQTKAQFFVDAAVPASAFSATITANYDGGAASITVTVNLGKVSSLDMDRYVIVGGTDAEGYLRTSGPVLGNYMFRMSADGPMHPETLQWSLPVGASESRVAFSSDEVTQTSFGSIHAYGYGSSTNTPDGSAAHTTIQVEPPGVYPVTDLVVQSIGTQNVLQWKNPTIGGGENLDVYYSPGLCPATIPPAGQFGELIGFLYFYGAPWSSYTHTGRLAGSTACYVVYMRQNSPELAYSPGTAVMAKIPSSSVQKWRLGTGSATLAPAAINGGKAFVATQRRVMYSVTSGTAGGVILEAWKPSLVATGPAVAATYTIGTHSEVVWAVNNGTYLSCLDASTGTEIWRSGGVGEGIGRFGTALQSQGAPYNMIVVGSNNITAVSAQNQVAAINPATGAFYWTFGSGRNIGPVTNAPYIDTQNNRVYFTTRRKYQGSQDSLWCLDFVPGSSTVTYRWSINIGDVDSTPAVKNGRVYAANNSGKVYAADAATGALLWASPFVTGNGIVKSGIIVHPTASPTRLFFSTNNYTWQLDDTASGPVSTWHVTTIPIPSAPVLSTDLYVGGGDGTLYRISATTGSIIGSTPLSSSVLSAPVVGAGSLLYVGSEGGAYFCVSYPF